jgi:hypothetical protein
MILPAGFKDRRSIKGVMSGGFGFRAIAVQGIECRAQVSGFMN